MTLAANPTILDQTLAQMLASTDDEHPEMSDDEVASETLAMCSPRLLRILLLPQATYAVTIMRRLITRQVEKANWATTAVAEPVDMVALRDSLEFSYLKIPGQPEILWLDATPEDHRAYADSLQVKVTGLQDTIRIHYAVADEIEAAGASCYRDLISQKVA